MSRALSAGAPRSGAGGIVKWGAFAVVVGLLLGTMAGDNPSLVIAFAVVGTFAVIVGLRPSAVLVPLGAAAFVENIQIGGATISRFIAAMGLFVVLAELARGKASILPRPPLYWITAYGIWALASQLWTVSGHRTYIGLSSLAVSATFTLALAALVRSRHDFNLALYGIAFGAATVGLVSMLLFVTSGGGRAVGFAGDPNFFAAYQAFAFPVLLALSAQASRRWVRLLLLAGVISVIGATFVTLSRGGILSLLLIGVILLVLPTRSVFRSLGQKTLAAAVITIGVALAITVSYSELSQRVNTLVTGEEAAGSGRLNEWKAAWQSAHDRPLLGLGFGAFPAVSNELVRSTPGTDLSKFDERPEGTFAHNAYLGSLAEIGVPGLVLFVGVMGSTALALRRAAAEAKRVGDLPLARLANALLISLAGWAFTSIFLSSETARPFWVTIGLALALPKLIPPRPRHPDVPAL